MQARKLQDGVWWVGANDRDRASFDELIPLPHGTSYNSYLVQGTGKTALIDAVDPAFSHVLLENLRGLQIGTIDYLVVNHAEQDHSGSVPDVLAAYPMAKAVVSEKCRPLIMDLLTIADDRLIVVKDGDTLDLGGRTLSFTYFPWVHWPETMLTWVPECGTLFPCDLFGSHLSADDTPAADAAAVFAAAKRYFAEIMMPFRVTIEKNLPKIAALDAQLIAPSHGPVCSQPSLMLDAYRDWAGNQPKNLVVIPYVSMHESTRLMVRHFVQACVRQGVEAESFNLAGEDIGEFTVSLVDAATVVFGSPTVLGGPHPKVAYAALLANALRPKTRFLSVIGSYGWGGKTVEALTALVPNVKAEVLPPVLVKGLPREKDYAALDALAATIREKHAGLPSRNH